MTLPFMISDMPVENSPSLPADGVIEEWVDIMHKYLTMHIPQRILVNQVIPPYHTSKLKYNRPVMDIEGMLKRYGNYYYKNSFNDKTGMYSLLYNCGAVMSYMDAAKKHLYEMSFDDYSRGPFCDISETDKKGFLFNMFYTMMVEGYDDCPIYWGSSLNHLWTNMFIPLYDEFKVIFECRGYNGQLLFRYTFNF